MTDNRFFLCMIKVLISSIARHIAGMQLFGICNKQNHIEHLQYNLKVV